MRIVISLFLIISLLCPSLPVRAAEQSAEWEQSMEQRVSAEQTQEAGLLLAPAVQEEVLPDMREAVSDDAEDRYDREEVLSGIPFAPFAAASAFTVTDIRDASVTKTLNTADDKQAIYLFGGISTCGNTQSALRLLTRLTAYVDLNEINIFAFDIKNSDSAAIVQSLQSNSVSESILVSSTGLSTEANSLYQNYYFATVGAGNSFIMPLMIYKGTDGEMYAHSVGVTDFDSIIKNVETGGLKTSYEDEISRISVTCDSLYDEAYEILEMVNKERAAEGLGALSMDKDLLDAAMQRAAECTVYYSHTRPNGSSCFTANLSKMNAENIAIGYPDSAAVMDGWMNSAGHRANILTEGFQSIGVGAAYVNGYYTWVQVFGRGAAETGEKPANAALTYDILLDATISPVMLRETETEISAGETYQLKPYALPAGEDYERWWSTPVNPASYLWSCDSDIARVDTDGLITALRGGTAKVRGTNATCKLDVLEFSLTVQGGTEPVPVQTVTFDSNGGSAVESVEVSRGGYVKAPAAPVRAGYHFAGWYLDGAPYDFKTPVMKDITLVAQWKEYDTLAAPTASLPDGMQVEEGTLLRLTHEESGVTIYYTLDGSEPTAAGNVYSKAIVLREETTVKAMASKEGFKDSPAAVFHYTIAEKGSLWGDVLPEDIPEDGIPEGMWIAGVRDMVYTGKAIRQDIRVYDGRTLLQEKRDYTVTYKNNTNAAAKDAAKAPSLIVKGKGNYGGKDTAYFAILPVDIGRENAAVTADALTVAQNGKVQKPTPVVLVGTKKLKANKDFTVEYPSTVLQDGEETAYRLPGVYEIVIKGKGNYRGQRTVNLTVTDTVIPMSKVSVAAVKACGYTGTALEPELAVKYGQSVLSEGVDYWVSFENNVDVGTATAILEGIGKYSGVRRVSFKITGQAISKATVTGLQSLVYNGEEQTIELGLQMKVGDTLIDLQKGKDYTVSYLNMEHAGTATAIFTGKGAYTGTLKKTFKIGAFDLGEDAGKQFVIESGMAVPYAKGGAMPKPKVIFRGTVLTEGRDYTLKYSNNKAVADVGSEKAPTVTVMGKGDFKGSRAVTFGITGQDIGRATLTAADKVYQDKANIYKTKVTVTDEDGKKLAAKKDYNADVAYTYKDRTIVKNLQGKNPADAVEIVREAGETVDWADIIPVGTCILVTVTAKEDGNYTGSLTGSYRIVGADISKATVKVETQTYTGAAVEPGKDKITVTLKGQPVPPENYEIVRYADNVKKGKGTVVIKGVGNYGGTKTVKFTIGSKGIGFLWW